MAEQPRRRSKLVGTHPAEQQDPQVTSLSSDKPETPRQHQDAPPHEPVGKPEKPVTRNPRRLRVAGKVNDTDLVSFNCKMSRGLRRTVRHFAADAEVDIQDVVAAALAEYLTARGREVPASELRQPD